MNEYIVKISAVMMAEDYSNIEEVKAILRPDEYMDWNSVFQVWESSGWRIITPFDYIIKTQSGKVFVMKREVFESIFKPEKI